MGCGQPSMIGFADVNVRVCHRHEDVTGTHRSQLFLDGLKVTLEVVMGEVGQNDSDTGLHCERSEQHATAEAGAVEKPLIPRMGMKGLSFAAH